MVKDKFPIADNGPRYGDYRTGLAIDNSDATKNIIKCSDNAILTQQHKTHSKFLYANFLYTEIVREPEPADFEQCECKPV